MFRIRTLGDLREQSDTGPGRTLRRTPLALVVYLARGGQRAVTRTELATLFWGERGEERARQSLRQALLEMKQALGESIEVDAETVRLAAGAVELDVSVFEREVSAGRLEQAAARWTGNFFEGVEDIGGDGFRRWIENERAGLHQQLGVAMEKLIGDAEVRGDRAAATSWAERWAAALPFDEPAHQRLIDALRQNGRSGDALQVHAAFVSRVRSALDTEPSDEFLRLGDGLAGDARSDLSRRGRGSAAIHAPGLVGRAAVVAELADAWSRTKEGSPLIVLVRGEPGSGLTRLCDEIAERAGSEGVVLRSRGNGTSRDYATAGELFDGMRHAPGLAGAAPEALAEVARIVPSLAARFPHLPPAQQDESALRDGLVQTLAAIAEEHPILLLVDDLQAADPASRRLLALLAPRLPGRVLLVLTDDESDSLAGEELSALLGVRGLRRLHLEELSVPEVEAMLGSMVTMDPGERRALAIRLREDSAGMPFLVRELVHSLVEVHLLRLDPAGLWRPASDLEGRPLPLPSSIREGVGLRLERMSPGARAVAEAVALQGPSRAVDLAELPADQVEGALGELAARRFLREDAQEPGRYRYASPLLARAVAANVSPARRHALRPVPAPNGAQPGRPARRRILITAAATVATAAAVAAGVVARGRGTSADAADGPVPVIALGRITDYRENAPSDLTRPLTDMLATNLGRIPRLRVVSTARMYELVNQGSRGPDTSAATLVTAARRAGATELVDGALYARAEGGFRLDLRRMQLGSGNILQTHSVVAGTVFELADSGTARLAADFGALSPLGSISDVTTRSVTAYRFYEQGLRSYYAGDLPSSEPLFEAALREDSTFAMAAYYYAMSAQDGPYSVLERFDRAARLATRTTDRERLTILARLAFLASSPSLGALGDTLVIRYPDEVEGYYFTGLARMMEGDFLQALASFHRVVAMDSLALAGERARCEACDALRQLISVYQHADSLPAAEREARRWTRLQPNSPVSWHNLADVLSQSGQSAGAFAALEKEVAFDAGRREEVRLLIRAGHHLYAAEYEQADRLYEAELASGAAFRVSQGLWYRSLSYRQQGRLTEALADARRLRVMALARLPRGDAESRRAAPQEAFAEAQVLLEMGRYRDAAELFDAISRWRVGNESSSQIAHARVWAMTHAAGARALAGDTAGFAVLADTLQMLGAASGNGRDRLLHHYVRGLLQAARGRDTGAVTAFREAVWSWSLGYTRVNLALAAALMRLGRAAEAVAALQPALRGNIEGSNFYVARTELHERLGQAWDAVGGPAARDSAAAHYDVVVRAWSRADPAFAQRLAQVKARVSALAAVR